ncbi:MAG: hypothetical protein QF749_02430 [Verrucomicrobiota bacterium]|nr:hypothetical protein [Verrucomicrobiota bacterium]
MSGEPSTIERVEGWSNLAIGIWVLIVFAAQLGVLFWLGRVPFAVRAQPKSALLRLMPEIVLTPDSDPGAAFSDPTLFSRPNRRGFSGTAWRRFSEVEHQLIEWNEAPRLLDNQPDTLGAAFREALPGHLAVVSGIPAKGLAKPAAVAPPPLALRPASELQILGGLAERPLVRAVSVPALPHNEALRRTYVRIGVNSDGYVVSATVPNRLVKGDAFQAVADQRALDLLRGIRFEPAKRTRFDRPAQPGALEWGGALFHWRTVAPPKSPSAVAPPSS